MPGRNGTGPLSEGPRTGWGMGNCPPPAENQERQEPSQLPPVYGRGLGLRRGFGGRGFRPRGRRW
jgi:hypothetical protein